MSLFYFIGVHNKFVDLICCVIKKRPPDESVEMIISSRVVRLIIILQPVATIERNTVFEFRFMTTKIIL